MDLPYVSTIQKGQPSPGGGEEHPAPPALLPPPCDVGNIQHTDWDRKWITLECYTKCLACCDGTMFSHQPNWAFIGFSCFSVIYLVHCITTQLYRREHLGVTKLENQKQIRRHPLMWNYYCFAEGLETSGSMYYTFMVFNYHIWFASLYLYVLYEKKGYYIIISYIVMSEERSMLCT